MHARVDRRRFVSSSFVFERVLTLCVSVCVFIKVSVGAPRRLDVYVVVVVVVHVVCGSFIFLCNIGSKLFVTI